MADHHFISYASDAKDFVLKLSDALSTGTPPIRIWLDSRRLEPGQDWDEQLSEAIRTCTSLIFVLTRCSVEPQSATRSEWTRALRYKKPIVPIRLHADAELPLRLGSRRVIDFSGPFEPTVGRLRKYLAWLSSPEGMSQTLHDRLTDAQSDLRQATDREQERIRAEIDQLEKQIDELRRIAADPKGAAQRLEKRIARGLDKERRPEKPAAQMSRKKFINTPSLIAPSYFSNRVAETALVRDFLNDPSKRMLTVVGRAGIGKSALVLRLLQSLGQGSTVSAQGAPQVDGIVYLSNMGNRRIATSTLFSDLAQLLPGETSERLNLIGRDAQLGTAARMETLLAAFPSGCTVLLLDGFDDLINPETLEIRDVELEEALRAFLNAAAHGVKVIITTRVPPRTLALVQPARQVRLELDTGLPPASAINLLRAMDANGTVGLRDAPDALLAEAARRTQGFPRALEALFAILSMDRDTSLPELLSDTEHLLPGNTLETLIGEAFSRLDVTSERVMQALAVYAQPVTPAAVDYLLQPYLPGVESAPVLDRLVTANFARREAGRYYLHPVDRSYAFGRVAAGAESDRDAADAPPFSQFALLHRAAEYFKKTRTPSQTWQTVRDLAPQLAEFELRFAGHQYDCAARLVLEIESHLLACNAHQLLIELYERLQGRLSDPLLQESALARLNRVRNLLRPSGFELRQTLSGHDAPITRLAWFPDGERLASASLDGTIRIWNVSDGTLWKVLTDAGTRVLSLDVTPDGRRLISASEDATLKIWDLATGAIIGTLRGHSNLVTAVAALPDGRIISASWDGTLKLWSAETGAEEFTFAGHTDRINALAVTPDGQRVISASWDQTLRVWNLATKKEECVLAGRTGGDNDVAVLEGGKVIASAAEDATVRIWDLATQTQLISLEGPTAYLTGVSASSGGDLLAAKSADGYVRLWRCDTWEQVAALSETSSKEAAAGIAFAPRLPVLATLGEEDSIIRIWNLDLATLLNSASAQEAVQYTTAKIVLVGESGVGKTGLGWRLAYGDFKEQSSTHGQHFWVINALRSIRSDQTVCDVVLWDFAGQPDYHLIHALFLDDVDLGLLLFDPTARQEALKPVEYWLKHLLLPEKQKARTILIGARLDCGSPTLTPEELELYCQRSHISGGYIGTSALTGAGVPELMARIKEQVNWEEKPPTVSPKVFTIIKEAVLALREGKSSVASDTRGQQVPLLLSPQDLSKQLLLMGHDATARFSYEQMMTAVRHLAKHGYVSILQKSSGEDLILLLPDLLNNLAASIVLEARRTNWGTIEESRLLRGDYPFPELARFKAQDREILLDAATMLFLKRNLCFRKTVKNSTLLVFPSLINQKRPISQPIESIDDVSFIVTGAVETVYPTLVVQLGNTNEFERTYTWQNHAQYEMGPDEVCGFRQVETGDGEVELILYYGARTPDYARMIFQGYFEKFLKEHQVSITKYPPVNCPNPDCAKRQEHGTLVKKIRDGVKVHFCGFCGTRIDLATAGADVTLSPFQQGKLNRDQSHAQQRAIYEAALVRLKRVALPGNVPVATPRCFISYAWGEWERERWVVQLATDLRNSGIGVVLDRWDNAEPGSSISRFISLIGACDFIAVVGTPEYKEKYENEAPSGYVVAAEFDLISSRLMGSELSKKSVIPLLLAGDVTSSFPPLLHGRVFVDFRGKDQYFAQLIDLIIKMFGLPFSDPAVAGLRESMLAETRKAGTSTVSHQMESGPRAM